MMSDVPIWLQEVLTANKTTSTRQNNKPDYDRNLTGVLNNPDDIRKRTQWNLIYKEEINSLIDGFLSGSRTLRKDYCSHLINLMLEHGKLSTTDQLKLQNLQRIQGA